MNKTNTFRSRIFSTGTVLGLCLLMGCQASRLSQSAHTAPVSRDQNQMVAIPVLKNQPDNAPATTLTARRDEAPAAAAMKPVTTAKVRSVKATGKNNAAARMASSAKKAGNKLKSLPARMLMKSAEKRAAKLQKKIDSGKLSGEEAQKAKAQIETLLLVGIIAAAVGLVLMLATYGAGFVLGVLLFVGGATVITLSLLDII